MRTYNLSESGDLLTPEGQTISSMSEGGKDRAARIWKQARNEVIAGDGEILPYASLVTAPSYRELRSAQYKSLLSPEGTFETTVGDLMDALIKAHYGDATELDQLSAIISGIKADIPEVP